MKKVLIELIMIILLPPLVAYSILPFFFPEYETNAFLQVGHLVIYVLVDYILTMMGITVVKNYAERNNLNIDPYSIELNIIPRSTILKLGWMGLPIYVAFVMLVYLITSLFVGVELMYKAFLFISGAYLITIYHNWLVFLRIYSRLEGWRNG